MAVQFTLPNIIQLASALAPILLGFFMVMLSILNQNVKGIVYLGGVLIATVINVFIMNTIKSETSQNASAVCSIVELPYLTRFNSPNPSSVFIAFTKFAYLFLPMKYNNLMNYPVIAALLALSLLWMRLQK